MTDIDPNLQPPVEVPKEDEVTLSKEEFEKLKGDAEAKTGLVSEVKDLREKKRVAEEKLEEIEKEDVPVPVPGSNLTPEKVQELVNQSFTERAAEDTAVNKESAIRLFKESHKEFHDENDEAGIKFSGFERILSRFNMNGLKSPADFQRVLNDAYTLTNKTVVSKDDTVPPVDDPAPSNKPAPVDAQDLTPQEYKIIEQSFDGDKERYLAIKTKRPDYVERLLHSALQ